MRVVDLLAFAGLEEQVLDGDAAVAITVEQERRLLERAVKLSGDPALGLYWGKNTDPRAWGFVSILLTYVPSFRQALEAAARYGRAYHDGGDVTLSEEGGEATVRFWLGPDSSAIARRVYGELFMSGMVQLADMFDAMHGIRRFTFDFSRPAHAAGYGEIFEGEVRFDAECTAIVLDATLLDRCQLVRDPAILRVTTEVAEAQLRLIAGEFAYSDRVREFLASAPRQARDVEQAARALGVSPRSLRRRLKEEDSSWAELLHEARAAEAKSLLARLSIQEAAFALGFTDVSAFHRAFKAWTGQTPAEFRGSKRA